MNFSIKDFLSKCDQTRSFQTLWKYQKNRSKDSRGNVFQEWTLNYFYLVKHSYFLITKFWLSIDTVWKVTKETPQQGQCFWPANSIYGVPSSFIFIAQKMKFSIKDFFNKCDKIRRKLRIWSHLLKKSLIENFNFLCSVSCIISSKSLASIH